ncbi:MAG: TatD family hydrolase [Candidatus Pacebacteria bacterium]|nr:TatD family hydrolase [Candidatus Paceibacterota bacterium]
MYIDTHAHLNFKAFDEDRDEVIKRSLANDTWMINPSSNYKTSKLAVEIAQRYEAGVFASVGLHPINCVIDLSQADEDRLEELDIEKYKELAKMPKVVAVGEIGLDYWNEPKTKAKSEQFKQKQKEVFLKQLQLAYELDLPVILHCRKAHDDLITLLIQSYDEDGPHKIGGVLHCFTGAWEQAQKLLDMGFYLGFNGIIFKYNVDEIIKKTPLDRMLIETDCPFLTPLGVNVERNEPINVKYVAQRIADIRGESLGEIAQATTKNAKKLFRLT